MSDNKLKVLREWAPFEYKKVNEGRGGNDKIIMRGILQKADVLNQNGRIYPRDILEKEIQNYQKFIVENRALGELDHPECVPRNAKIKTVVGWQSIEHVNVGDNILTLEPHTGQIQPKPVIRKIDEAYKGKMIRIKNSSTIDMLVTPNHRVLVYEDGGLHRFMTALEFKISYDEKSVLLRSCTLPTENPQTRLSLDDASLTVEEVDFDDNIYCVSVDNGTWLMEYNGAVCWTGNSSVVELKNVSHIVREAKMDREGVVWGAIEVLPTPSGNILRSLVESGITIGISSRGVGSTRSEGGKTLVQDDFQLICWDIVSEPSTPNAFVMRESREVTTDELKKLRESRFTKDVMLDRIFNEMLTWRKK